ncbi:MAG TPA: hypothetical protein DIT99_18095 [Candidatus Latescibacteria bacterium]|nr:hypothetical protein [Candidatus Latescibacterota bacterium]
MCILVCRILLQTGFFIFLSLCTVVRIRRLIVRAVYNIFHLSLRINMDSLYMIDEVILYRIYLRSIRKEDQR